MNQYFSFMKQICVIFLALSACFVDAQSPWPAVNWAEANNLTAVMDSDGITDLSGLHWNPETNRLYCVQGDGRLRVLQMDATSTGFAQIANKPLAEGPEGITQVNFSANEFYTIDENNYEIRKFTHNSTFGNLTESRHWDLLAWPSPMQDTGNTGPEGIAFIPDEALTAAGFVSQQTGALYTSTKGMGGLMFIAHQDQGYIWVFDVNPSVTNDFAYVGKYKTNHSESADLAFDRSTGLLYILHNVGANYLETTDLSSAITTGAERKFVTKNEYFIAAANDGNANVEGFALMPKCPSGETVGAWLARDVENNEGDAILHDCLRWFLPFAADGSCGLSVGENVRSVLAVFPNPAADRLTVNAQNAVDTVRIIDNLGQTVAFQRCFSDTVTLDISTLARGFYMLEIRQSDAVTFVKWLKN